MLRAVNQQTRVDVISVDDQSDVESLRQWSRDNLLICPGCKQPVHFRAGETRVWHFAHKHRGNCTYDEASTALLQARAWLYMASTLTSRAIPSLLSII